MKALLLALLIPMSAWAQSWPTKPVKVIVTPLGATATVTDRCCQQVGGLLIVEHGPIATSMRP